MSGSGSESVSTGQVKAFPAKVFHHFAKPFFFDSDTDPDADGQRPERDTVNES
jgi:hypothetical protein